MPGEDTDRIAREAARRLVADESDSVADAIRQAADDLKLGGAPLPGHGRVRAHVQAMTMQAMGLEAYQRSVREVLETAEQLMTLLEETFTDAEPILAGRAVRGEIDAGVTLQVRLYGQVNISELARELVCHGYEEPSFETADTRFGRLSRLRFIEEGLPVVITLCPTALARDAASHLFTGRRIAVASLRELRQRLSELP